MNTALTRRDRDGDRETKANGDGVQMLRCAAITVHSLFSGFVLHGDDAREPSCLIGNDRGESFCQRSQLHTTCILKPGVELVCIVVLLPGP